MSFDTFLHAYRTAILLSTKGDDGHVLAMNYRISDFSEHASMRSFIEARDFYDAAKDLLSEHLAHEAGVDFWSVRNAKGDDLIGFMEYGPIASNTLCRMARACGRRTVYVNDQGLIEIEAI